MDYKRKAAHNASVGADEEQPNNVFSDIIIAHNYNNCNSIGNYRDNLNILSNPYYVHTLTLTEIYNTPYECKEPIIDGLLYTGAYLFVGSPKVGKSFLMAQLAYHVSTGKPMWDYNVHQFGVAYFALEHDFGSIQQRMFRMFGDEANDNLRIGISIGTIDGILEQQLDYFSKEHPNVKLIIIDTLQRIRENSNDYSYKNDYQAIAKIKAFADNNKLCIVLVHHTRKQKSEDNFDMILGTNGLLGAADAAFVLYKDKHASEIATLEISGRDLQEQKLILKKNPCTLYWELQDKVTELWKEPPDPFIEAITGLVTADSPDWAGTATELQGTIGIDIPINSITKRLNINASRLLNEHRIVYRNNRTHDGRRIELHYIPRDSS